jgi:hypothetical protein
LKCPEVVDDLFERRTSKSAAPRKHTNKKKESKEKHNKLFLLKVNFQFAFKDAHPEPSVLTILEKS